MIKRHIGSAVIGTLPVLIGWIGGMDFVRGPDLALAVSFGIFIGIMAWTCPVWEF